MSVPAATEATISTEQSVRLARSITALNVFLVVSMLKFLTTVLHVCLDTTYSTCFATLVKNHALLALMVLVVLLVTLVSI